MHPPSAPDILGSTITGMIEGLPEGTLARVSAGRQFSEGSVWGDRPNGTWILIVEYDEKNLYVVKAQAEDFSVQPKEYIFYFKDGKAYIMDGEKKTDIEATQLDFRFSPLPPSATP
jgi:hypothetical protein